jgi:hypothetical protein
MVYGEQEELSMQKIMKMIKKNKNSIVKTLAYLIVAMFIMRLPHSNIWFIILKFFGFYYICLCGMTVLKMFFAVIVQTNKGTKLEDVTLNTEDLDEPFVIGDDSSPQHYLSAGEQVRVNAYMRHIGRGKK